MMREVEIYGHRLLVEHTANGWLTHLTGDDGKRGSSMLIPAFVVTDDSLLQYLADFFHESARPDRQAVRWIR